MRTLVAALALALLGSPAIAQQALDPGFKPSIASPAYKADGPVVAIDEAHANFHTLTGRYKPFADLLKVDGYRVRSSTEKFSAGVLKGVDILVVANAGEDGPPVFTQAEADALHAWVEQGGSLLLIADHEPFGASAEIIGQRFGVGMGKGWVYEPAASEFTSWITFSRDNKRLGVHPITEGRNAQEKLSLVRTFTGQSLTLPSGATALLRLPDNAREAKTTPDLEAARQAHASKSPTHPPNTASVAGRVQGLAVTVGKGRLVVLGEAGMLSAQIVNYPDGRPQTRFGMNLPGTDDQQFALNIMHWLSRKL